MPSGAELVARAEALRPQLLHRQEEAERRRQLPEAIGRMSGGEV